MKKLIALLTVMTMIVGTSMAQYSNNGQNKSYAYNGNSHHIPSKSRASSINSYQKQARERIADGIVSGAITSHEAKRLLEYAERIEMKENKFMRNGRITGRETQELKEDLNDLNRMIMKETRDRERSKVDDFKRYDRSKRQNH